MDALDAVDNPVGPAAAGPTRAEVEQAIATLSSDSEAHRLVDAYYAAELSQLRADVGGRHASVGSAIDATIKRQGKILSVRGKPRVRTT